MIEREGLLILTKSGEGYFIYFGIGKVCLFSGWCGLCASPQPISVGSISSKSVVAACDLDPWIPANFERWIDWRWAARCRALSLVVSDPVLPWPLEHIQGHLNLLTEEAQIILIEIITRDNDT